MGFTDGGVVATVKVVDHGPDDQKWNLVVTGDGFTLAELGDFASVVDGFVAFLQTAEANPLSASLTWNLVNVHRIDVVSDESGADSPNCDGTAVATYYDSEFCVGGIDRALFVDEFVAIDTANSEVPEWDAVLVIVNSTTYGGASTLSGDVAAASLYDPNRIGLHELGHAAFGLHDEYCDQRAGVYTGAEPLAPNVTAATTLATLKWADKVAPGTAIPTRSNPDQSGATCDTSASPVPTGTVGLFEGAMGYAVGAFRPTDQCRMISQYAGWCQICSGVVLDVLYVQTGASPCWVASSVYGNPHHPDVVTLRAWRDRHLQSGARGARLMRLLAASYLRIGPVLARTTRTRPRLTGLLRTRVFTPWARALRAREGALR